MSGPELADELRRVVAPVVGDHRGQLLQGVGERLHGDGLLAGRGGRGLHHRASHDHLAAAAAVDDPRLADRRGQDAEGVVERALGLVDYLLGGAADDDGAGLAQGYPGEAHQRVLADHYLMSET